MHNMHLHSIPSNSQKKPETSWEIEYFIEPNISTLHSFENEVAYLFCKVCILFLKNRLCFF